MQMNQPCIMAFNTPNSPGEAAAQWGPNQHGLALESQKVRSVFEILMTVMTKDFYEIFTSSSVAAVPGMLGVLKAIMHGHLCHHMHLSFFSDEYSEARKYRREIKCLISPWGQSWERIFHKHKCYELYARVLVENPFPRLSPWQNCILY